MLGRNIPRRSKVFGSKHVLNLYIRQFKSFVKFDIYCVAKIAARTQALLEMLTR